MKRENDEQKSGLVFYSIARGAVLFSFCLTQMRFLFSGGGVV